MNRGDVVRVDLPRPSGKPGREQFGIRPAIVVQDDKLFPSLPTVLVVPLTSNLSAMKFSGCIQISPTPKNGLTAESVALTHQVRAIDRGRIESVVGILSNDDLTSVDQELRRLLKL